MKAIWKFPFFGQPGDTIVIPMPEGAEIVRFALQGNTPTAWALVDPRKPKQDRRFTVTGTGHKVPDHARYVGTFDDDDPYVWHAFEVTSPGTVKSPLEPL